MSESLSAKAKAGYDMISAAIADFVIGLPDGARNDEVARGLDLESSFEGGQRNSLTHTILNDLVRKEVLVREKRGHRVYYKAKA